MGSPRARLSRLQPGNGTRMGHLEVGFEQENPNVVGQTSGLTVAIPPVSLAVTDRHPEDARTGRPDVNRCQFYLS